MLILIITWWCKLIFNVNRIWYLIRINNCIVCFIYQSVHYWLFPSFKTFWMSNKFKQVFRVLGAQILYQIFPEKSKFLPYKSNYALRNKMIFSTIKLDCNPKGIIISWNVDISTVIIFNKHSHHVVAARLRNFARVWPQLIMISCSSSQYLLFWVYIDIVYLKCRSLVPKYSPVSAKLFSFQALNGHKLSNMFMPKLFIPKGLYRFGKFDIIARICSKRLEALWA